ncbi:MULTISPECIES: hypothetical protein [unclassified Variovorax]|uniref:hypothetical protein n=1 Tax=unclassified Variovorax TaxID=663243 RepID=UPI00131873DE|nr:MULTISPECIES: hypothetical protein [unclassified Variovorax]VTU42791.1 hypothetical protein H6P1_00280 [Variovorax sp. PBL-H6]VTU43677.1 hypothetical protein SRS16P1_00624 [Variovorax sp. SRS16]VTU43740.1 hypothetical protein E5P1_00618 [Variovorax sp. PBL-E5]
MSTQQLNDRRTAEANAAFQAYDFGTAVVESADGWNRSLPGTEMVRTIYLAPEKDGEPTERAYFTVRFSGLDTSLISEAYAITVKGGIFGTEGARADALATA